MNGSFYKKIFIAVIIVAAVSVYPLMVYATRIQTVSVLCGFAIALLNALVGYELSARALTKSNKMFMMMVFGGMGIRMMALAIIVVILVSFTSLDMVSLLGSVVFFYFLFMVIEIQSLLKQLSKTKSEINTSLTAQ